MKLVNYRSTQKPRVGVDYSKEELVTVPDQSMSLKEILTRFVKKQSLPVEMDGFYDENSGYDLEKFTKMDIEEQRELIGAVGSRTSSIKSMLDAAERKAAEEKAAAEKAKADQSAEGGGKAT